MSKETMTVWQAARFAVESLKIANVEIPRPGANQVLLKVEAVSLNYRDKLALEGESGTHHTLPVIPVSDAAGVVAAVGSNASRFAVGDRVTTIFAPKWLRGKIRHDGESATLGLPLPGVLAE
jgi:NADPH:quinone reductase-like Zn-dependent oxidoreductase